MRFRTFLLSGILWYSFLPGAVPLEGQEGAFAFKIRGGASIPVAEFRAQDRGWEGKTGMGPTFGMGFTVPFPGPTDAYLGFSQHRFSCDENVCPRGKEWVSTGFDLALRKVFGQGAIRPWIQAGFRSHRMEGRVLEEGDVPTSHSEGGSGFEVGGGILIRLAERTSLSPGIRYGEGTVPFPDREMLRLRYLVADLGLVMWF